MLFRSKVLDVFRAIQHDPSAVKRYLKEEKRDPSDSTANLRAAMERCQSKIEKLTGTLATNAGSAAAKYIVSEIEKLDIEYNSLRKKLLSASANERRAATHLKSAMEKRDEIIRLLDNFEEFSAEERNEIAKEVLSECVWDGETLFITL